MKIKLSSCFQVSVLSHSHTLYWRTQHWTTGWHSSQNTLHAFTGVHAPDGLSSSVGFALVWSWFAPHVLNYGLASQFLYNSAAACCSAPRLLCVCCSTFYLICCEVEMSHDSKNLFLNFIWIWIFKSSPSVMIFNVKVTLLIIRNVMSAS